MRLGADAVIVHHGYFWKGESPVIRGMKRNRLKTLLANDINLYGWHLPLDAHPELGNNAQLAALLGITVMGEIEPLVPWGELTMPVPGLELASWIEARLGRKPLWCGDTGPEVVQRVAWCTGAGKVLSIAPRVLAWMLLLLAKFLNRPFIQPASRDCIFMLRVTMPLNAVVFAR